ncbi:MAG: Flp pilus assembly complex ATPase component TadA [Planctomycetota bacterium]|nr:Flp pilus assembly complex ATPase component TadA [Planctomycetota bacterium]
MGLPYLEIKDTAGPRRVELDGGPLTIGRNFTNLLVLEEPMASRFHCVIEKATDGFLVRDLDSRNGTRLNGKPVKAAVLMSGDVVSIGKTEMKLIVPIALPPNATPKDHEAGAVEELAGLVGEDEESEPAAPARKAVDTSGGSEYEKMLRERADSLADRAFTENDISLINARGKIAHSGPRTRDMSESVNIMRLILLICFRSRATDLHIEPKTDDVHVRGRVDGSMVDIVKINKDIGIKLSSMVKVLSDIDIAQKNIVQEGHFAVHVPSTRDKGGERRVDYRVSFAPAMHGQKLVIRVLDAANAPLHVDELLMPARAREIIRGTADQESGMILVCGPTGSGKTTTLYSILRDIDVSQRNVVTIEDPVEIQLEGVTQIPVNEAQGNTFSALLRSVLRQDPDVILIGEIRDAETARVGVQAGMTGHLVFSTVHARDAISGMFRLLDLGVEPYVVASGLHLVVAQRLVRQLCTHCKVAQAPTPEQIKRMADSEVTGVRKIYSPKGCRRCLGTGYLGRRGIFEVLSTTSSVRDIILKTPTIQECRKAIDPRGYMTLAESGYRLVADGVASLEEIEKTIA